MNAIKVTDRGKYYIDFDVVGDTMNKYRYESHNGKMHKLYGSLRSYHQAIRGNARKEVEALAKIAYENGLDYAISI